MVRYSRFKAAKVQEDGTYAFEVGLQGRKHLFDRSFDEDTADETETLAVGVRL